ncbi:MAG: phosphate-starvation-inducible PsiE family protein [Nitrospinae bacterium]|nr:phosphate-starvation-inducible PsiE family protein [Nitrospinota bacterium]
MNKKVEIALKEILINVLMFLAMVEIFKTTMVYFTEGRVRVTFVVDTILIVVLTESMSILFGGKMENIFTLILLIITLVITRVVAVRYSPTERGELN